MIEVFKTNVKDPNEATWLIQQIARQFPDYLVNFDLDDCDRIMRVRCDDGLIQVANIIALLNTSGFTAEVLEDDMALGFSIIHG